MDTRMYFAGVRKIWDGYFLPQILNTFYLEAKASTLDGFKIQREAKVPAFVNFKEQRGQF
jgi:hypothetical protein